VQVVRALGAQPRYLKAELMAQAADLLAAETAERHRTVVLIVDLCRVRNYADSGGWPGWEALPGRAS
jgi:type II secretory pathway predicted ATPase ExeA